MSRLEDIVVGSVVEGLATNGNVSVIAVKWHGNSVIEVTFKDTYGNIGNELLYRDSESSINVVDKKLPWSFDADGNILKLVSEANRIHLAYLFDPYLAIHTSSVEPLPHQITAVYQEMLPRLSLRFVLADDPGAGKTIMAGLLIKEMMARGDLKRCLIVSPGNLTEQWQDEMLSKFHINFEILTNERIESAATGNIFNEVNLCIARLDKLARNDLVQEKLKASDWDLIICDEAHKMSATIWGGEVKTTKRFQLGRMMSEITRNFLLLTATPHNGKEEDFQLFLSLVDPDRFEGVSRNSHQSIDVSDVMRRLVKEELLKFDGTPLFPERRAYTVNYTLSDPEMQLYADVTRYVEEEFNRMEKLDNNGKTAVGFALTILQRRLASSPEAIYQSLRRRRERLEKRLTEVKNETVFKPVVAAVMTQDDYDDLDDAPSDEVEGTEESVVDQASASRSVEELMAEISTLKRLESMANNVRMSGEDRKWEELSKLLQDSSQMYDANGLREKIIIFTEHRDTLNYLVSKTKSLLGSDEAVVMIHGGMLRDERRKVEHLFKEDKDVLVLVATDAAGEGINLQRAHLMVNYDLPWNPNRLEQRFGRIHRIGQTEVCHLWNLVSKETREGAVFQRLFEKLEEERSALGGKVFDILGKLTFDNKPLRDLLIEAIRYGNDPKVRARLHEVVDATLDTKSLQKLLDERALTDDVMDIHTVSEIREKMDRIEAHKLQPNFIRSFFIEAFTVLGGKIVERENGRYEITNVPVSIRTRDSQIGYSEPVLKKYERVCFDKSLTNPEGMKPATLICPGHPLMEATIDVIRSKYIDVLKNGAILVDDNSLDCEPRLLFYIENSIQDGKIVAGGKRVISKSIHFVELKENGESVDAGLAPYLDYRSATEDEQIQVRNYLNQQSWVNENVEEIANTYAIANIVPKHLSDVKDYRLKMINKTNRAVKERLTNEIQYWDYRSTELKECEMAGKVNAKLNSDNAQKRADDLAVRLKKRLQELSDEARISASPPVITGGAFIVPRGLLDQLGGSKPTLFAKDRKEMEMIAMDRVMAIERELGFAPKDVSKENRGYDVESSVPVSMRTGGGSLRFIEVKGRVSGADYVTVSKNEILTALNKPEEFIFAVVEVDGKKTHAMYFKKPFHEVPDFCANSVNYDLVNLKKNSEMLLERWTE